MHPQRLLTLCFALLGAHVFAHGQASPLQAPNGVPAAASAHAPVTPVASIHRPTRTENTPVGVFEGVSEIGSPVVPGSSSFDPATGTYRITSSGYNIWFGRDEFRFLWKKMRGDVSLAADVHFENPEPRSDRKLVLVLRQTLEDDSKEAIAGEHGTGMVHLARRPERGAMTTDLEYTFGGELKNVMAQRLGIEKHGDQVQLFVSIQGEAMQPLGPPVTLHLTGPFYVGIGFCPHVADKLDTGVFSDVVLQDRAGEVR